MEIRKGNHTYFVAFLAVVVSSTTGKMQTDVGKILSDAVTVADDSCENQSEYFSRDEDSQLLCDKLDYTVPYCMVTDNQTWSCLRKRALMHNQASCECYNPNLRHYCSYIEMCVFADDTFECDLSYKCTSTNNGQIICTGQDLPPVFPKCIPSLLYCPEEDSSDCLHSDQPLVYFESIFKENCMEMYEKALGRHKLWYYVNQRHFNNKSYDYSIIRPLSRDVDVTNICVPNNTWKYVLITLSVFVLVVGTGYGAWRFKRYQALEEKNWNTAVRECVESRYEFMFVTPPTMEVTLRTESHDNIIPGMTDMIPAVNQETHCEIDDPSINYPKDLTSYHQKEAFEKQERCKDKQKDEGKTLLLHNVTYTGVTSVAERPQSLKLNDSGRTDNKTNHVLCTPYTNCSSVTLSLDIQSPYINESFSPSCSGDGYMIKSFTPSPRILCNDVFLEDNAMQIVPALEPRSLVSMNSYANCVSVEISPNCDETDINRSSSGSYFNEGYTLKTLTSKASDNEMFVGSGVISPSPVATASTNLDNPAYLDS